MGLFKKLFRGLGRMFKGIGKIAGTPFTSKRSPFRKLGPLSYLIPGVGPALGAASSLNPITMGARALGGKSLLPRARGVRNTTFNPRTGRHEYSGDALGFDWDSRPGGFGSGGGSGGGGFGAGGGTGAPTEANWRQAADRLTGQGSASRQASLGNVSVGGAQRGLLPSSTPLAQGLRGEGGMDFLRQIIQPQDRHQLARGGVLRGVMGAVPGFFARRAASGGVRAADENLARLRAAYAPSLAEAQRGLDIPLEETDLYKADVEAGTRGLEKAYQEALRRQQEGFRELRSAGGQSGASGARMAAARELAMKRAEREQRAKTTARGRASERRDLRRARVGQLQREQSALEQQILANRAAAEAARRGATGQMLTGAYGGYTTPRTNPYVSALSALFSR